MNPVLHSVEGIKIPFSSAPSTFHPSSFREALFREQSVRTLPAINTNPSASSDHPASALSPLALSPPTARCAWERLEEKSLPFESPAARPCRTGSRATGHKAVIAVITIRIAVATLLGRINHLLLGFIMAESKRGEPFICRCCGLLNIQP